MEELVPQAHAARMATPARLELEETNSSFIAILHLE